MTLVASAMGLLGVALLVVSAIVLVRLPDALARQQAHHRHVVDLGHDARQRIQELIEVARIADGDDGDIDPGGYPRHAADGL